MPDKRDMHQAKSHRNSKSNRSAPDKPHGAPRPEQAEATTTATALTEPLDETPIRGKKNKSRR